MTTRDDVRAILETQWPWLFLGPTGNDADSQRQREAIRHVAAAFGGELQTLANKGVSWDQMVKCLAQLATERGHKKLDRGQIKSHLWTKLYQAPVTMPVPVREPERRERTYAPGPLALYARDPEAAVRAYPSLHKPVTIGGKTYPRRVDAPYARSVLRGYGVIGGWSAEKQADPDERRKALRMDAEGASE